MSDNHIRRAKRSVHRRRSRLWLLSLTLPVIAITPAIWSVAYPPPQPDLQTVIKQVRYDPLVPPSRLRGPGAIYEVADNGSYLKVCDTDPALLEGRVQESPTESYVLEQFRTAKFSLGGQVVDSLNATLGGSRVTAVEYSLTNVVIREIRSLADLHQIQVALLEQKSCDEEVARALRDKRKVCSAYAALAATAFYKIRFNTRFASNAGDRTAIIDAAQRAIREQSDGEVRAENNDEIRGENLIYGIQMAPRCIVLDTDTEPSVLPPSLPATPAPART